MLTTVAPFIIYLSFFPVLIITLFRVEVGILYFITIVPFVVLFKRIAEFPGGNNFADFLLIAIILGWIIGAYKENRRLFNPSPVNIVVVLFILQNALSLINGSLSAGFPPEVNMERLINWKNFMILPPLYFIAANNIKNDKQLILIIIFISIAMVGMDFNFYSTFRFFNPQHYTHDARISGGFGRFGVNEMALCTAMYTFLIFGISYFIENKKIRYFILFVCACNLYPIIFSYSRSGYFMVITGILLLGILKDRKFLLLILIIAMFYRVILPTSVIERIDMTFLDSNVTESQMESSEVDVGGMKLDTVGRAGLWDSAMVHFHENPLLGMGFDTFRYKEGMITHSHYLKLLSEDGIVGFFVFIIFTITILRQSYKLFKRSTNRLGKGIGLGFFLCESLYLVGGLTGDISIYYELMAIRWFFLGVMAKYNYISEEGFNSNTESIANKIYGNLGGI